MKTSNKKEFLAIMFADIAGFSAIMQDNEAKASMMLTNFKKVVDNTVANYQGRIINYYGDGVLSVFKTPIAAVDCAVSIQKAFFLQLNIPVRIGINSGTVVLEEDKAFGDSINLASRIESLGVPGSVLLSKQIRDDIKNQKNVQLTPLGSFLFKNIDERVEVYAINEEGLIVPDKRMLKGKLEKEKSYLKTLLTIVGSLIILCLLYFNLFVKPKQVSEDKIEQRVVDINPNSIAVLPFTNMSEDEDNLYFSEGIHDDLLTYISKLKDIKVISRTSVLQFKNTLQTIPEISTLLGVKYILEGSVRKAGENVRINVQLIDGTTDEHIWAEIFDRQLSAKNIFSIQTEIAQEIAKFLKATIIPTQAESLDKKPTESLMAYDLYLKAKNLKATANANSLFEAKSLLEEAVAIDPNFAEAYILLGTIHIHLIYYAGIPEEENYQKAWNLLEKAVSINSNIADAYILKGSLYHWWKKDIDSASTAYEKAIELNPNADRAYYGYAIAIQDLKRDYDKVIELNNKALDINPMNPQLININGIYLNERKRFREAIKIFKKGIEINPKDPLLWANYSESYIHLNQLDTAALLRQKSIDLNGFSGLYADYYLESLQSLGLYNLMKEQLTSFIPSSQNDSIIKYSFERNIALINGPNDDLIELSKEIDRLNQNKTNSTFETYFYNNKFKEATNLYESTYSSTLDFNHLNLTDKNGLEQFLYYIYCLKKTGKHDIAQKFMESRKELFFPDSNDLDEKLRETNNEHLLQAIYYAINDKPNEATGKLKEYYNYYNLYAIDLISINPIFKEIIEDQDYQSLVEKIINKIEEQQQNFRSNYIAAN